jgi:hypothetical protein
MRIRNPRVGWFREQAKLVMRSVGSVLLSEMQRADEIFRPLWYIVIKTALTRVENYNQRLRSVNTDS